MLDTDISSRRQQPDVRFNGSFAQERKLASQVKANQSGLVLAGPSCPAATLAVTSNQYMTNYSP
jgi:hypothetical protein